MLNFRPACIWELLDPTPGHRNDYNNVDGDMFHTMDENSNSNHDDSNAIATGQSPSANIQVTTRFTQPVEDDPSTITGQGLHDGTEATDPTSLGTLLGATEEGLDFPSSWNGEMEQFAIHELFPSSLDLSWMGS